MSVEIKFNGSEFFKKHEIPTPFVEREASSIGVESENRGFLEGFTLSGQIFNPKDCNDFAEIRLKQEAIINGFGQGFGNFQILEDNAIILEKDFVKVLAINFSESQYVGTVDFSISLEVIDEKNHNNFFGVKDPKIETNIQTLKDGLVSVSRSVSSVGINTQDGSLSGGNNNSLSSALSNSINFAKGYLSKDSIILPVGLSSDNLILKSESENIDRVSESYSVNQEYVIDSSSLKNEFGILRYKVERNSTIASLEEISISGTYYWGNDRNFSEAREKFSEIDFFQIAKDGSGNNNLVKFPTAEKISENINEGLIDFSFSYDNDKEYNNCGIANKVNYSIEEIGGKIKISVSGKVLSRGPLEKRFELVKNEFYDNVKNNIYSNANQELENYFPPETPTPQTASSCNNGYFVRKVRETPETFSIVENEKTGEISYEYQFVTSSAPEGFNFFNISSQASFPIPRYLISINAGGGMDKFIVSRSGFDKASISVSCTAVYDNSISKTTALDRIEEQMESHFQDIECSIMRDSIPVEARKKGNPIIVDNTIREDEDKNSIEIIIKKDYYDYIV